MARISSPSDPIEKIIAVALDSAGIRYVLDGDAPKSLTHNLDFYIPDFGIHIEVSAYYTARKIEQLSRADSVIYVQGRAAANAFAQLLKNRA